MNRPAIVNSEQCGLQGWALLQAARVTTDAFPETGPVSSSDSACGTVHSVSFHYSLASNRVMEVEGVHSDADLVYHAEGRWQFNDHLHEEVRHTLQLYLPVLGTHLHPRVVIGHLGQSIDARIATLDGDAVYVTGAENRRHLHRLRSLSHAVIVGAGTVIADDPQLTTRAVSGASPVRVIIDPAARVPASLKLLHDGEAPTVLLHADSVDLSALPVIPGCRRIPVQSSAGQLQPGHILDVLAALGLKRVFVEGGGVTVSRFFNAGCLNRLHIAVAPLLVGDGIPALQLPAALSMQAAHRPPFKLYRMGHDVMWDFDLDAGGVPDDQTVPLQRLL